ncbi:uncharacterized protein LOC110612108 isoform X1 [Manihot esculenta]|uniref:Uncharacterized protein n=3 Tax=Manihot esculenta TaxID=3983 RepID=A0ACB7HYN6_MANES|nr:uncharacterized protein LOC110612108 isoform X1 [Manihot esculenta]XP_021608472.2 uncharacterized protein LOC110612108 isoform X1 [Manihot esculenta]KAG8657231.1 hypothetical protein MANES_03G053200v8 [Manihot esculenta]KAG8657234.1 hypothetical protein MANES_03G053200v8 [Manihot esculenta]KAG8657235.1 hypothetical protein MANES_03G053200v8 [Manihot esculenta]
MDLGKGKEVPFFDLNLPVQESLTGLGFQDSISFGFPQKVTEFNRLFGDNGSGSSFGGDLSRVETDPDVQMTSYPSVRRRYSIEEKAKAKMDDGKGNFDFDFDIDIDLDLNLSFGAFGTCPIETQIENIDVIDVSSCSSDEPVMLNTEPVEQNPLMEERLLPAEAMELEQESRHAFVSVIEEETRINEEAERQRSIARIVAKRFAHPKQQQQQQQGTSDPEMTSQLSEVDSQSPFSLAMEAIKKRNSRHNVHKKSLYGIFEPPFKWVPANNRDHNVFKRYVPKLLDICLDFIAKNADKIVSLENIPDNLKHKLSQMVSCSRKVDARFVELLAENSPTEIRVWDTSRLTEEEFSKIFSACDTKNLTVLQLDLCGLCMPDYVLYTTLARQSYTLSKLATLSLRGAHRLSDSGLSALAASAPVLQSINLSQCSLLTSSSINDLASHFESTLRELYLDDCQNIDAMLILPALKKFKHLEVLSVAGIRTVRDGFVIAMAETCGMNMKELVFANCVELSDISLKSVGKRCPNLCALDLSHLHNLTDKALQCLANGCQSIRKLKLCRNDFSDEAIAAFLEACGESINVLSLNNISRVENQTALSIAKCSRNLLSLDLSWCRKLTNEALGLIVDSCSSLKVLKLFGCSQVTDVFLNGHSNSLVHIIGCKMTPVLEHLDSFGPQETPLRYSPLMGVADQQSV